MIGERFEMDEEELECTWLLVKLAEVVVLAGGTEPSVSIHLQSTQQT
jgi:hypothetical protein